MRLVTEAETRRLANPDLCLAAVRDGFIALARGVAHVAPIVIGEGHLAGSTFSVKAGWFPNREVAGFKIGAYWPGNEFRGLPRHNSTIFLLDPTTGRVAMGLEAAGINGLRTAAADAIATDILAHRDSETLGVVGGGNQARFEIEMLLRVRPNLREVLIGVRDKARAADLVRTVSEQFKVSVVAVDIEAACRGADILVTVTPSRAPLVEADWVRSGTHISAMGADQTGKQELSVSLVERCRLFADHPPQSVLVGEFQHVFASRGDSITAIGDVLAGKAAGRTSDDDITIFDSSGVAIQDLLIARSILDVHESSIAKSNNAN